MELRGTRCLSILVGGVLLLGLSGCPVPCDGRDPAAVRIDFTLVETTTSTSGTVRITGVVTNRGMQDYNSSANQQSVDLYEGGQLVAQQAFTNLAVGESVEVSHERSWSLSDEFRPPAYTVRLSYDPDIFIDGNDANDDCNLNNNAISRATTGIDALFGG